MLIIVVLHHSDFKRKALPVPEAVASMFDGRLYHPKPKDEPDSHQGRSRLFEHERGNWATYIYVPCESVVLYLVSTVEWFFGHY